MPQLRILLSKTPQRTHEKCEIVKSTTYPQTYSQPTKVGCLVFPFAVTIKKSLKSNYGHKYMHTLNLHTHKALSKSLNISANPVRTQRKM